MREGGEEGDPLFVGGPTFRFPEFELLAPFSPGRALIVHFGGCGRIGAGGGGGIDDGVGCGSGGRRAHLDHGRRDGGGRVGSAGGGGGRAGGGRDSVLAGGSVLNPKSVALLPLARIGATRYRLDRHG